ncbi:hypothetical protein E3N88_08437 [Mikania micrantha]|uniref:Uncharacterized protein n=1 Tax=Mikania micrantha TaxID=192012 RepID=A0A5N6PI52_9ASTR|nr:hypothetical protein E3N88_08437 [Mikania micrantha]
MNEKSLLVENEDENQTISDSDSYCEEELPADYEDMMKWSTDIMQWTTKKEAYSIIRKGFLIDDGEKWFFLDKNGKKCHKLSAAYIRAYSKDDIYLSESRFKEATLLNSSGFSIKCEIESHLLSPQTTYETYLVYKYLPENQSRFEGPMKVRNNLASFDASFDCWPKLKGIPQQRNDGWIEVKIWEFRTAATIEIVPIDFNVESGIHYPLTVPIEYYMDSDNNIPSFEGLVIQGVEKLDQVCDSADHDLAEYEIQHGTKIRPSPEIQLEGVVEDVDEDEESDSEETPIASKPVTKPECVSNKTTKEAPFPEALVKPDLSNKTKRGPQQDELWEVFKQVKINLPLLDAIKQVPVYAKYLKELCTQKRQHKLPKKLDVNVQVSAILSGAHPPKLEDPGTPLISIQIGDFTSERALLDLGASISILPGSLYDQFDFGVMWNRLRKGKGKQTAEQGSSSRQKSIAKKRRTLLVDESESDDDQIQQMGERERRQMEADIEHIPKPTWQRDDKLSTLPEVWQEDLYREKMTKLKRKEDAMVTERAVLMPECTALGIVECFQRLALMRQQGALHADTFYIRKQHKVFSLSKLDSRDWGYIMKDILTGQSLKGLKSEMMEESSEEEEDESEEEEEEDETENIGGSGTGTGGNASQFEDDLLTAVVHSMRPKEFHQWPPIAQLNWDRNSREYELNRKHRERQELIARSNAYFAQQEINARFADNEQIRHYEDYYAGRPYREHPRPVEWSTAREVDRSVAQFPYPQTHSSSWAPLPTPQEQSGSFDPFNLGSLQTEAEALLCGNVFELRLDVNSKWEILVGVMEVLIFE